MPARISDDCLPDIYHRYMSDDETNTMVAEAYGVTPSAIRSAAHRYAARHGLPTSNRAPVTAEPAAPAVEPDAGTAPAPREVAPEPPLPEAPAPQTPAPETPGPDAPAAPSGEARPEPEAGPKPTDDGRRPQDDRRRRAQEKRRFQGTLGAGALTAFRQPRPDAEPPAPAQPASAAPARRPETAPIDVAPEPDRVETAAERDREAAESAPPRDPDAWGDPLCGRVQASANRLCEAILEVRKDPAQQPFLAETMKQMRRALAAVEIETSRSNATGTRRGAA